METLKDPAMMLSVVNTVGLLGEIFYTFKRMETVDENIAKLNAQATKSVSMMTEIKKENKMTKEHLQLLTTQYNQFTDKLKELSDLSDDITDIIDTLYDHDIEVVPSERSHRSGDRRDARGGHKELKQYSSERSYERRPERKQEPERSRERKPERRQERKQESERKRERKPERKPEPEPKDDTDDDEELLRGVRESRS
jgi:hypothetical protein